MGQSQRPKSCLQARQGAARAAPFGLLLILNPSLRWVPLEPDSTNQGDRSNTMNPSAAGLGRQSKREGEKKKESSWDKITSQDRRLRGSGAGSPAQESVPALPQPLPTGEQMLPVCDGSLGSGRPKLHKEREARIL